MTKAITSALLADLFAGHKTNFRSGFDSAAPLWAKIATRIPSNTLTETYSWLGEWPRIREWVGDRVIKQLGASKHQVVNRDFESTISVKRNHIVDDQLGIYGPMFQELGRATAVFPDELVFERLAEGHQSLCYDGQNYFDTDHPVGDGVVSNNMGGGGTPWFLLDTSRALKPLIFQDRQSFDLAALDRPTDDNVFMRKEFIYGVDGRGAGDYGFWQMGIRSAQTLDAAGYKSARSAMASFKSDEGRSLKTKGTLLVVPPALEGAGRELIEAEKIGGTSNIWRGTCELMVATELA